MKRCPKCGETYTETERFCASDGTPLDAAPATAALAGDASPRHQAASDPVPLCPACGAGFNEGEETCRFCGYQLSQDSAPRDSSTRPITSELATPPIASYPAQSRAGSSSAARTIGYVAVVLLAAVGGAWFALRMSASKSKTRVAQSSPVPTVSSPVSLGALVDVADNPATKIHSNS